MKLSEFVRETLNSVVSGVVLSQEDLKKRTIMRYYMTLKPIRSARQKAAIYVLKATI